MRHAICFAIVACFFSSLALAECVAPRILAPLHHATMTTPQPVVVWAPSPMATSYDIALESRVLEGEVAARQARTVVALSYMPSSPLTAGDAVVTARVRARCPADMMSEYAEIVFFIALPTTCPAPAIENAHRENEYWKVSWKTQPTQVRMELRIFSGEQATPDALVSATTSPVALRAPKSSPQVLGVRAQCANATSAWRWIQATNVPLLKTR